MSYANGTTHFNLPQTVGSDKRDWFDTNQAFSDVDEALWGAKESAESAASQVTTLGQRVSDVENDVADVKHDITTIEGDVSGLQTAVTNLGNKIDGINDDITDAICAIKEADATADYVHNIGEYFWYNDTLYIATSKINVGAQIVPNTNCNTVTITTEMLELNKVSTGTITPASGMTISNAVLEKSGRVVHLVLEIPTNIPSAQVVATLPVGFRPRTDYNALGRNGNSALITFMVVRANGQIYVPVSMQGMAIDTTFICS